MSIKSKIKLIENTVNGVVISLIKDGSSNSKVKDKVLIDGRLYGIRELTEKYLIDEKQIVNEFGSYDYKGEYWLIIGYIDRLADMVFEIEVDDKKLKEIRENKEKLKSNLN